ncbi:MAG: tetratricopeptide repeat protein [Acidobacteria bacterium]|nr:tetratricopeptide repeat protein [Acidobacteriota bacterium]
MHSRSLYRGTVIIILLLLLAAPAAPAQSGHSIRGKVRDAAGGNVGGLIVDLQSGNGVPVGQTTTTSEGDFFFGGLSGTSYTVSVRAPDRAPASEMVSFVSEVGPNSPGESRNVDITLRPREGVAPARAGATRVAFAQSVPASARAAFDRGMKLARDGKAAEAERAVREAVSYFPDYFDARFWLANELIGSNRLDEAVGQLEAARRVNPSDERVYLSFGQLLSLKHNYGVAAAVFAEAARLSPTDPQPFLHRGTALVEYAAGIDPASSEKAAAARRAALEDAEKALSEAYRLSGRKLGPALLQLARVYEKRGERARAADELERYLRDNPDAPNAPALRDAVKTLRKQ